MIKIRPIYDAEQLRFLGEVAKEDNHGVIGAAHLVIKNKEIIGYVGSIPALTIWMHTKKAHVRDSIAVMHFAENYLAAGGAGVVGIPCADISPYLAYLEKDPEVVDTKQKFFMKNLKGGY